LFTVIFETKDSYTNDVKAIVKSADEGNYIDWRNDTISRVEITSNDHNTLAGKQGGTNDEFYQHQTVVIKSELRQRESTRKL
jgi:hypothetical protein